MPADRLTQLLQRADRAAGPLPALPGDFVARVLRRSRRTRRLPLTLSAAAALLLALGLSLTQWPTRQEVPDAPNPQFAGTVDPELAALQARIDAQVRLIAQLQDHQDRAQRAQALQVRLAASQRGLQATDPSRQARAAADRAAEILVRHASKLQTELDLPVPAMDAYRMAIALFPDAPWTAVARDELIKLQHDKGGPS